MNIAYFTSLYGRASDTFIRREIAVLRGMGHTVRTFSVRRPEAGMNVSEEIQREQAATGYVMEAGVLRMVLAALRWAVLRPRRAGRALLLGQRLSPAGIKARLWHVAYFLEACLLAEWLLAQGAQHLHNHIGENSAAVAMLASEVSGVPYSLTIHGPPEFFAPVALGLGTKIARSRFTVCISDFGRSQCMMWAPAEAWDKLKVVRCGVDDTFLRAAPEPIPAAPRLVCVGRLCAEKGQRLLVEAIGVLRGEGAGVELDLIGDGPERPALEAAIARLRLSGCVRLLGWRDEAEVRRAMLASRALVLPSFAEGLPVVLMEAMALGRPVVSTYIAAIPELVQPGVSGWLVPAGSLEGLVEALREVIAAAPERLEEMGRAGAARVRQRHSAVTEAGKLARLFEAGAVAAVGVGRPQAVLQAGA